jgi:hypothetical protein
LLFFANCDCKLHTSKDCGYSLHSLLRIMLASEKLLFDISECAILNCDANEFMNNYF